MGDCRWEEPLFQGKWVMAVEEDTFVKNPRY